MTLNDLVEKIFVINLDRFPDRWKYVSELLDHEGIKDYERIPGVNINEGHTIQDREAGCREAHINCLNRAKDLGLNHFILLEDDVCFLEGYTQYLSNIKQFIESTVNWEMIYLGGNTMVLKDKLLPVENKYFRRINATLTTHAIIINKSIIDVIIQAYESYADVRGNQADLILVNKVQARRNSYIHEPRIVFQKNGYSYIQGKNCVYDRWLRGEGDLI